MALPLSDDPPKAPGQPGGSTRQELEMAIERCDQEIARCKKDALTNDQPFGPLLGLYDWFYERELILKELENLK